MDNTLGTENTKNKNIAVSYPEEKDTKALPSIFSEDNPLYCKSVAEAEFHGYGKRAAATAGEPANHHSDIIHGFGMNLKVGDKCDCKDMTGAPRWRHVTVIGSSKDEIKVRWEGWNCSWDETIRRSSVRLQPRDSMKNLSRNYMQGDKAGSAAHAAKGLLERFGLGLEVGDECDCLDKNKWRKVSIIQASKESVKVHWEGWEARWDEYIPRNSSRLQPLGTQAAAANGFSKHDDFTVNNTVNNSRKDDQAPPRRRGFLSACTSSERELKSLTENAQQAVNLIRQVYSVINTSEKQNRSMDEKAAEEAQTSLLYGEIKPEGVEYMMDHSHMRLKSAKAMVDIGSGVGKLSIQCFHQYRNINTVIGVEISKDRYAVSKKGLDRYEQLLISKGGVTTKRSRVDGASHDNTVLRTFEEGVEEQVVEGKKGSAKNTSTAPSLPTTQRCRTLELHNQDIGKLVERIAELQPTVITMDVAFAKLPSGIIAALWALPKGARVLTFEEISSKWPHGSKAFPFRQINKGDRYLTSWSSGHPFKMWEKLY